MEVRYIDRLKAHPGVPTAAFMTVAGGMAGGLNESMPVLVGIAVGSVVTSVVCWIPVLITARTQPVPGERQ